LGFGMNAAAVWKTGKEGLLFTVFSIVGTLGAGLLLGRWMRIERKTSLLISGGTAICGGSAIAALTPVIRAEERQTSVALGVVSLILRHGVISRPFGHVVVGTRPATTRPSGG